jgi:hypothetical protein
MKDPHPSFIDSIICAEIPNRLLDPLGYNLVDEFMVHGPCGKFNKKCLCMKDNKCSIFSLNLTKKTLLLEKMAVMTIQSWKRRR